MASAHRFGRGRRSFGRTTVRIRLAGGAALAAERGPRGPIRADFEAKVRGDNESVSAKRPEIHWVNPPSGG